MKRQGYALKDKTFPPIGARCAVPAKPLCTMQIVPSRIHNLALRLDFSPQCHMVILPKLVNNIQISSDDAHLSFPLSQHRLRRSSLNLRIDIFRGLRIATSVINPISNLPRIHPYEFLCLVKPFHFELLLTDRAETVCESRVIRNS